jgi:hypothetical protein
LLGQIPLEPTVAAGSDAGEPVALAGTGPAAEAFRAVAHQIVTETVPPVQMDGCSARQGPDEPGGYTEVTVSEAGVVIESVTPVSLRGGQ